MIANGMRKLRERADVADAPERGEPCGYRDAAIAVGVEHRPGFFARLKGWRRAKQMLELERRAER
jgi:hypothetical protein